MILVDSSVWIDFPSSSPGRAGAEVRRMIAEAEPFAFTGVIVSEVLQGLTPAVIQVEHYLSMWKMLEPWEFSTYRQAAVIFRLARAKGIALTTIDTLIAAIALEHGAALTLGKEFPRIARRTRLPLYSLSH